MDSRRSRTERGERRHPFSTQNDLPVVKVVAHLGCATVRQAALFLGWTERKASNHLRNSYDLGYLGKCLVTRSQLAARPDPRNIYGSAPDIFVLERKGREAAAEDMSPSEIAETPDIHDKTYKAAHHLMIRDVRVWVERVAREFPKHRVIDWQFEDRAKVANVIPDAWLRYGLRDREFGLFVEADRGTESLGKWQEKVARYAALLREEGEGTPLFEATGMAKARVLTVVPDADRRDWVWGVVEQEARRRGIRPGRFLVGDVEALESDFREPSWIANGMGEYVPLVRPDLV